MFLEGQRRAAVIDDQRLSGAGRFCEWEIG